MPPVKPPVKQPEKKVVESDARENLSPAEAEDQISRIRQKTKGGQVAKINLSWMIEE